MARATTIAMIAALAACGGGGSGSTVDGGPVEIPPVTPTAAPRVSTVASGLVNPWSLAFLPDGRMLVTEKAGRLRLVNGSVLSAPISGVPVVDSAGQGGLFDVAVAADFATTRRLYLSYAEPGSGVEAGRNGVAVGTAVLSADGSALAQWQVIFRDRKSVV